MLVEPSSSGLLLLPLFPPPPQPPVCGADAPPAPAVQVSRVTVASDVVVTIVTGKEGVPGALLGRPLGGTRTDAAELPVLLGTPLVPTLPVLSV